MICPACDRDNHPRRRYCGKCGFNFEPVCRRCSFANESTDRFCGGCGSLLIAKDGCHPRPADAAGSAPVRAPSPGPAIAPSVPLAPIANELAGLFTPTVLPGRAGPLPSEGIGQDDLDRLFGGKL